MCIQLKTFVLRNGHTVEARCRKCFQCRRELHYDWVGRCIAEAQTADHVRFVTLTYGRSDRVHHRPDGFGPRVIVKRDIQNWFKRIRAAGFTMRYFAAAEFGRRNNRVHWHILAFFYGKCPEIPLFQPEGFKDPFWSAGFTKWFPFNVAQAFYCCKYILKDATKINPLLKHQLNDDGSVDNQTWSTLSRKPPLGAGHFMDLAVSAVVQGLPARLSYNFEGVTMYRGGPRREFYLRKGSAAADLYLYWYRQCWREIYGNDLWPNSEAMEEYEDRLAGCSDVVLADRQYRRRAKPSKPAGAEDQPLIFIDALNTWCVWRCGERLLWTYGPDGQLGWVPAPSGRGPHQPVMISEAEAADRRRLELVRTDMEFGSAAYREASQPSRWARPDAGRR